MKAMKTTRKAKPTFLHNVLSITLPRSWQEVDDDGKLFIFKIMMNGHSPEQIKTYALMRFANVCIVERTDKGWLVAVKTAGRFFRVRTLWKTWQVASWMHQLDWITEHVFPVPVQVAFSEDAPDPTLAGVPFQKYLIAENYYQGYLHTKDDKYIVLLAKLFYPKKRRWTDVQLFSVFFWWFSFKIWAQEQFPYFFTRIETTEEQPEAVDMVKVMDAQIRILTGGDITKEDIVFNSDTRRALTELNEKAREAKEMKKQMKSLKNKKYGHF